MLFIDASLLAKRFVVTCNICSWPAGHPSVSVQDADAMGERAGAADNTGVGAALPVTEHPTAAWTFDAREKLTAYARLE